MTDNEIAALFRTYLRPAIRAITALATVELARSFQPSQQGKTSGPCVYFYKVADRRYGWPEKSDKVDLQAGTFTHTESQQVEATYQFSAWVPQTPSDAAALTESDILNTVSGIMQSDSLLASFRAAGVGIQRITDVRNPYIVDDHDQFEAVPSFDIVLTHSRILVSTLPAVATYDANIGRV